MHELRQQWLHTKFGPFNYCSRQGWEQLIFKGPSTWYHICVTTDSYIKGTLRQLRGIDARVSAPFSFEVKCVLKVGRTQRGEGEHTSRVDVVLASFHYLNNAVAFFSIIRFYKTALTGFFCESRCQRPVCSCAIFTNEVYVDSPTHHLCMCVRTSKLFQSKIVVGTFRGIYTCVMINGHSIREGFTVLHAVSQLTCGPNQLQ